MSEFITFKKYNNPEEAGVLVDLLKNNDLEYQVTAEDASEDVVFAGNTIPKELSILVKESDIEAAEKLLEEIEEVGADRLEKDYYLFEFTDNELHDILKKPDEWSLNDYHWAREILKQRGKDIDDASIERWKNARLETLSKTEEVTVKYQILAYFFCIIGGFIGIFMGRHLSSYKKTLPNGQKMFAFDDKARKLGYRISIFGFICLITWIVLLFSFL